MVEARGFSSAEEMNEALIEAWNSTVSDKGDLVYHLGDVTFGGREESATVLKRLNGQKHFVRGNHDAMMDKLSKILPREIVTYKLYDEVKRDDQHICLFHFPIASWHRAHFGAWHLHGHCHGNLRPDRINGPMLDVGVDNVGFAPISFEEVRVRMAKAVWKPIDQHGLRGEKP